MYPMDLTEVLLSARPALWLFGQILNLWAIAQEYFMNEPVAPPSSVMSSGWPDLVNTVSI